MSDLGIPPQVPAHLECQTPECAMPVSVIITRLEDGESDCLCMGCTMAFWTAVLMRVAEQNGQPVPETAPVT